MLDSVVPLKGHQISVSALSQCSGDKRIFLFVFFLEKCFLSNEFEFLQQGQSVLG